MAALQFYSTMLVAIDGWLQHHHTGVSVWSGIRDDGGMGYRAEVTWALPEKGFEWDGRALLGTDRTVRMVLFAYSFRSPIGDVKEVNAEVALRVGLEELANLDMSVRSFEISKPHGNKEARVRAVFECDAKPL